MPDAFDVLPEDAEEDIPQSSSAVLDECFVYAHQSKRTPDTLNIEIDAPDGITVAIHINDGDIYRNVVGELRMPPGQRDR